ncbi:N-acetylglucosamine kinase-like BadF-type ATPase [Saccharopolyspora erythraea NRRL 2338]|uniref:ATPase, BadF/BadG/BcrA/BcrD type n=2 Tax=Saccharopolyspora erythraea TaxID=1836 RepID=A4F719_SACEN|nr:BadF/BadG/BcrA/BcrD ATPase family protein [Saccharopolyspora erythraea]EQD82090.1 ATPase [Saccharopolyspora erythraea D]PFG93644.1 N-acetylglucosamine kinase-like BadF-type ATPase [Saccharopolyspora erythraea NRRL 2338]QRK90496.1 ATPase [Saccharopolyspora erythraea]CAL99843.1 ATPase, BadF/BadG/BcrA/BcrD type [Saccharopolyspora erythraea NRRL 2338]
MRSQEPVLVLGLDIGGTTSRALVGDLSGRALGTGSAGGGNPNSHPPERAAAQVAAAAADALRGLDPASVRAGVLGMAGASKMTDPAVAELFRNEWSALGLTCPMRVVGDVEVAFAAGTPEPGGTVVIAGTGSVAARIEDHRLVASAGGHGWLLGDEGSAFWLGREAVRATLHALDRGRTDGDLVTAVLDELVDDRSRDEPPAVRNRLITAVNSAPPIRLAELAPLVTRTAGSGDEAATAIVRSAARLLADTASITRPPGDTSPVVLAGGLVGAGNPVGDALRAELAERFGAEPRTAGPGAAGAAWLAAVGLAAPADLPTLHKQFLSAQG